ncbi:hypothetical protein HGRIS_008202 [Hohenbuehelia grisea]|uniref:Uncharacterized protein n=1 Tax=Hohenbuehelia grisea TaxID=104357 RepID=A0ABR3J7F8_9AGAR
MTRPTLPTGNKPGWDTEDAEIVESLKSIPESFAVLQSLRHSREFWLSVFPKFSSKGKGKAADVVPPPHTPYFRGRCDLEIGPLIFPDTAIYEVHYLPVYSPTDQRPSAPYSSVYTPYGQQAAQPTPAVASSPLLSSLSSLTHITPNLINKVNSAAATNPTLANLLQLAANGGASGDQLKTLGLLIQSLASTDMASGSSAPSTAQAQPAPSPQIPLKEFDFVLEFQDIPHERFLFPRSPVVCERLADSDARSYSSDVTITFGVPFEKPAPPPPPDGTTPGADTTKGVTPSQVVALRIHKASPAVWDTLSRWTGDAEKMKSNREILDKIKEPERVYLAHRLSEGPLLSLLQAAAAPTFTMKSIDPAKGGATKPRRRPAKPKQATDKDKEKEKTPRHKAQAPSVTIVPAKNVPQASYSPAAPAPAPPPSSSNPHSVMSIMSLTSPTVPTTILSLAPPTRTQAPSAPTPTPPTYTAPVYTPPVYTPPTYTPPPTHPPPQQQTYTHPTAGVLSLAPNTILSLAPPGHVAHPPPSHRPSPAAPPPAKKKRTTQPKAPVMRVLSCHSCGQTDVPLVLGGRFCRPCVDNGKADLEIPQLKFPAHSSSSSTQPYLTLTPQHISKTAASKLPPAKTPPAPSNPSGSTPKPT